MCVALIFQGHLLVALLQLAELIFHLRFEKFDLIDQVIRVSDLRGLSRRFGFHVIYAGLNLLNSALVVLDQLLGLFQQVRRRSANRSAILAQRMRRDPFFQPGALPRCLALARTRLTLALLCFFALRFSQNVYIPQQGFRCISALVWIFTTHKVTVLK